MKEEGVLVVREVCGARLEVLVEVREARCYERIGGEHGFGGEEAVGRENAFGWFWGLFGEGLAVGEIRVKGLGEDWVKV